MSSRITGKTLNNPAAFSVVWEKMKFSSRGNGQNAFCHL